MISTLTTTYKNWRSVRSTLQALNGLTEHGLNDLGLSRGDVDAVALASAKR